MTDSQVGIFKKIVKWEELASQPVGRSGYAAVLLGGVVYVGGGYEKRGNNDKQYSYRLDVYNLITNSSGALLLSLHHTSILL